MCYVLSVVSGQLPPKEIAPWLGLGVNQTIAPEENCPPPSPRIDWANF